MPRAPLLPDITSPPSARCCPSHARAGACTDRCPCRTTSGPGLVRHGTIGRCSNNVSGPKLGSHLEISLAVDSGIADAGLGLRESVTELGLGFIPRAWEPYDIALPGTALSAGRFLITAVTNPSVQAAITVLGR
jgi:hypothetical protein